MFIIILKKHVDFSSSRTSVDTMDFVTWFKDKFSLDKSGKITKSRGGKCSCGEWALYSQVLCDPWGFLLETKAGILSWYQTTCLLVTKLAVCGHFTMRWMIFSHTGYFLSAQIWKTGSTSPSPYVHGLKCIKSLPAPVLNEISSPERSAFFP